MFDFLLILFAALSLALLTVVSILPLLFTGKWIVRLCDFPRLQILGLLLVPLGLLVVHCLRQTRPGWVDYLLGGLVLAIALWQAAHVIRFTRLWPKELPHAELQNPVRLVVANLDYENQQKAAAAETLRAQDADLLMLIEIDEKWREALASLRADYPYHLEEIRGNGTGIALWSRLKLSEAQVRFLLSEDRPSLLATLALPSGGQARFVGLHPVPPGIESKTHDERRDSRERDAELVLVARQVREEPAARWIVAGDFNDVAWSHTTRLFKRLSNLRDPRIGRTLLNTYHAQHPLLRYPIDQLFLPEGSRIQTLRRLRVPGSDHFGFLAEFVVAADPTPDPIPTADREQAAEIIEEGAQDARHHDGE